MTTAVFDKTGTLTRGEFRVVDVATDGSLTPEEGLWPRPSSAIRSTRSLDRSSGAEEQGLAVPKAKAVVQSVSLWPNGR